MKKVLFVATVSSHIMAFHIPYLKHFQELGWETHVACNVATGYETSSEDVKHQIIIPHCDYFHNIPFERSPLNKENLSAYKQMKKLVDGNHFDIIHCHTPVGGAIARLAARTTRKSGTRVFYTAHGFHFYKGAPFKNWILYYPIEKWLAKHTDCLITINNEDYQLATSKHFKAKRIEKVNGVGIDLSRFSTPIDPSTRNEKRISLGLAADDIVLLSVGELSARKNHEVVIRALSQIKSQKLKYLICGTGELHDKLINLISELHLENQVFLMGFQKPVDIFYRISDIFVFPSLQEGLPVALLEAMACGMPVICSDIRGNNDLISSGEGGLLGEANNSLFWKDAISCLASAPCQINTRNINQCKLYEIGEVLKNFFEYIYGGIHA